MARQSSNGKNGTKEKTLPIWSRKFWTGSGVLEVACWNRTVGDGDEARDVINTSLKKTYKAKNGEYEESGSFRAEELGLVILALQSAFAFISEEQART